MSRKKKYKYPTTEVIDGEIKQTKCYKAWNNMMTRCTYKKYQEKYPTYIGCTVCDEWLDFDNFYVWFHMHYKDGFQLDKDILHQDNKVYSPLTCVFVPSYINKLLIKCDAARGELPLGVDFHKASNKYRALLKINCKLKHLGLFTDPIEAHQAYCTAKYAYIKEVASEALKIGDIDQRTYDALLNYKIPMY